MMFFAHRFIAIGQELTMNYCTNALSLWLGQLQRFHLEHASRRVVLNAWCHKVSICWARQHREIVDKTIRARVSYHT